MSPTARPNTGRRLAGIVTAIAVATVPACGGPATQPSGATDASTTAPAAGAADFCAQAADIDERVDAALTDQDQGGPSITDAFRQLAGELRGIDAPVPIATAWADMSAGLTRMADAFAALDLTDADSLEALDRAERSLTTASAEVESYLADECGL